MLNKKNRTILFFKEVYTLIVGYDLLPDLDGIHGRHLIVFHGMQIENFYNFFFINSQKNSNTF